MLSNNDQLEIYEENDHLWITYKWFNIVAYFLVFFCIAWNAFLIFWYSMAISGIGGGGIDIIMMIFPLGHVAVGIGLTYYTICLFLNKTYIDINKDFINVSHKPIPWWKGNVEFLSKNIKQLYVKETTHRGKNGTHQSYDLRVKLKDGGDKSLFSLGHMESTMALQLEERIEAFLGIKDEPVKGEYGTTRKEDQAVSNTPPIVKKPKTVYQSTISDLLFFKGEQAKVVHVSQYNWNNGNSDKLMQLMGSQNKAKLLFIKQNKGISNNFSERELAFVESYNISFSHLSPPKNISFGDVEYALSDYDKGQSTVNNLLSENKEIIETEQWIYQALDATTAYIRVVVHQGQATYYKGEKLENDDVSVGNDFLDLNALKRKDEKYRKD